MTARSVPAALVAALLLSACGDPIADSGYEGTSLLDIQGTTTGESPYIDLDDPILRASIFWNPAGAAAFTSFGALSEQSSNGVDVRFPGLLDWNLFDVPLESQLATSSSGAKYGLGFLALYRDYDGDHILDGDDELVGVDGARAVLYAPSALLSGDWPGGHPVPAGYHLISLPLACDAPPPPAAGGDCGVPLGASCTSDAECGDGGTCLTTEPFPWPGGACALFAVPGGCAPAGAALFAYSASSGQPQMVWVPACTEPTDCTRGAPFQCDYSFGACLPTDINQIVAADTVAMPIVCRGGADGGT